MLWKLIVDREISEIGAESVFSEMDIFQLKGCYSQKVDTATGLLSSFELSSLLTDLGWGDKEKVLAKFKSLSDEIEIDDFKTTFQTFVSVLSTELHVLRNSYYELDTLLSSIDKKKTGFVSIQDLRELLLNQSYGANISPNEFDKFVKLLTFPPTGENNQICTDELKKQILFGFTILGV